MKSLRLLFVSVFFLFLAQSCSTVGKKIASRKERVNEEIIGDGKKIKIGLWVEAVDTAIRLANYKNGLKQGKAKMVYRNGEYSIANYKDDILEGWERFYSKNGIMYQAFLYKKGNVVQRMSITPVF